MDTTDHLDHDNIYITKIDVIFRKLNQTFASFNFTFYLTKREKKLLIKM